MNMQEFLKVKKYSYHKYCKYLQSKYGIGRDDYMTKGYSPKPKCKRTNEGLYAHHIMEWDVADLSDRVIARSHPIEFQAKENIAYCDYLEHLWLHILIDGENGSGGLFAFMIPELNDVYSGFTPKEKWRKNCYDKVINDKDVYLEMIKELFKKHKQTLTLYKNELELLNKNKTKNKKKILRYESKVLMLESYITHECMPALEYSYHGRINSEWGRENNKELYKEIRGLVDDIVMQ